VPRICSWPQSVTTAAVGRPPGSPRGGCRAVDHHSGGRSGPPVAPPGPVRRLLGAGRAGVRTGRDRRGRRPSRAGRHFLLDAQSVLPPPQRGGGGHERQRGPRCREDSPHAPMGLRGVFDAGRRPRRCSASGVAKAAATAAMLSRRRRSGPRPWSRRGLSVLDRSSGSAGPPDRPSPDPGRAEAAVAVGHQGSVAVRCRRPVAGGPLPAARCRLRRRNRRAGQGRWREVPPLCRRPGTPEPTRPAAAVRPSTRRADLLGRPDRTTGRRRDSNSSSWSSHRSGEPLVGLGVGVRPDCPPRSPSEGIGWRLAARPSLPTGDPDGR